MAAPRKPRGRAQEPVTAAKLIKRNARAFREELDISIEVAAILAGVGIDLLRKYEKGKAVKPEAAILAKVARVYGRRSEDMLSSHPAPFDPALAPAFALVVHPQAAELSLVESAQSVVDELNQSYEEACRTRKHPRHAPSRPRHPHHE